MRHDHVPTKGYELDALSPWRKVMGWKSGTRRSIKRLYWRRVRRAVRMVMGQPVRGWM